MQIQTNQNQRELKPHGDYSFPVLVSREHIYGYKLGIFSWHWHPEIELTLVESGRMVYQVNGTAFRLKQGDVLFGNSNTLHSGHFLNSMDCYYRSITFDAKLIYGFENSLIQTKYVNLMVSSHEFSALHLDGSEQWHNNIRDLLTQLILLDEQKPEFYEMEIQMLLSRIWVTLLRHHASFATENESLDSKALTRLKTILNFIHEHYGEKISLEDIAGSIHICKSECCRFFKKHMRESLFDYLLHYRVEQSIPFLRDPEGSVTEAAFRSGFSDAGYYSRVFHRYTGCSPREFRHSALERV